MATLALRTLVLVLCLGVCVEPLLGDDQPDRFALIRESPSGANLVLPGSRLRLQVRVANLEGSAASGVRVLFAAPRGSSGTFESGGTLALIASGVDGVASVEFTFGVEAEPLVLSAKPENASRSVEWAFTVAPERPFSEEEAAAVLLALQDRLQTQPHVQYFGPFLLPAGSALTPVGQFDDLSPIIEVAEATWFVLIDDAPEAAFTHPMRYALLPAGRAGAPWAVSEQGFWPI